MKKELIYEFSIEAPLTPAKRKIVEKHVGKLGEASEKPLSYEWVDDGQPVEAEHDGPGGVDPGAGLVGSAVAHQV